MYYYLYLTHRLQRFLFYSYLYFYWEYRCVVESKFYPPEVIWDEFTAVPFVYIFCIESLDSIIIIITGFLLFRFFDISKPLGIKKLQLLSGGLGVMIDDIVAAVYSACILFFIKSFSLSFIGYQF